MVELSDISVSYGKKSVLHEVSLRAPQGAHIAVMGASGSGKSTLLHVIAGLKKPDSGTVTVDTERISMLFQQPRLLPWLTAAENVNCVLSDTGATMAQAQAWLDRLGLAAEGEHLPSELSGGMQQRVALARALAFGGGLVLLDEPFQGLDEGTRAEAIALCREVLKDKTTILVTHVRQEAELLADVIYTLDAKGLRMEERE